MTRLGVVSVVPRAVAGASGERALILGVAKQACRRGVSVEWSVKLGVFEPQIVLISIFDPMCVISIQVGVIHSQWLWAGWPTRQQDK